MYPLLKPLLFLLEPETAHHLAVGAMGLSRPFLPLASSLLRVEDERLKREVFGLTFPNPVGLAAGLDKNGDLADVWEKLGFGFAELGTFTARPQDGNPSPRVFRLPSHRALINRMGFPNRGAQAAAARLKALKESGRWPSAPVGINIGKSKLAPLEGAVEDYLESLQHLAPYADYVAVNVSSPNTPGLRKLQEAKPLRKLLTALVRADRKKPFLLKLAPDLEEKPLKEAAATALEAGCAGLIATNTTLSREDLPPGRYPDGGLSGAPLKAKSLSVLRSLSRFTRGRVPLVAVGGVFNGRDVRERLEAGASLVQVYTAYIYEGPRLPSRICSELLEKQSTVGSRRSTAGKTDSRRLKNQSTVDSPRSTAGRRKH